MSTDELASQLTLAALALVFGVVVWLVDPPTANVVAVVLGLGTGLIIRTVYRLLTQDAPKEKSNV